MAAVQVDESFLGLNRTGGWSGSSVYQGAVMLAFLAVFPYTPAPENI
jgi:hypothetical protein